MNTKKILGLFLTLCCFLTSGLFTTASAAPKVDPLLYLRQNYPKLTNEYENELLNFPVHYIFAVDVSLSMHKYEAQVDSAIVPFIKALPDNDFVTFIRFATEARNNDVGFTAKINQSSKNSLINSVHKLYTDQNLKTGDFLMHTDIAKAVKSIAEAEKRHQEVKQNVVVIITDFRHEAADGKERKLNEDEICQLHRVIEAANIGKESRNVALKLRDDDSKPGYCLNQLRDQVFPTAGKSALQIVPVGNSSSAINDWFEGLRRDIMVSKLAAIIEIENKAIDIDFEQEVNIDGDVRTKINWKPTRLYKKMRIDSSVVAAPNLSGFSFDVNGDELGLKNELSFESELGQLEHSGFGFLGFHHMTDSLQLGVDMPTDFDEELKKLEIDKPISTPKKKIDKWIFTFPLPFWLAALIAALLLLYIIMVLRQIKINSGNTGKFRGEIAIKNIAEDCTVKDRLKTFTDSVAIGKNGTGKFRVQGVAWTFQIRRETYSIFNIFKKPKIVFKVDSGFVFTPAYKNGVDGKEFKSMLTVYCGAKRGEKDHQVTIRKI